LPIGGVDISGARFRNGDPAIIHHKVTFLLRSASYEADIAFWSMIQPVLRGSTDVQLVGFCDGEACINLARQNSSFAAFPIIGFSTVAAMERIYRTDLDGSAVMTNAGGRVEDVFPWRTSTPTSVLSHLMQVHQRLVEAKGRVISEVDRGDVPSLGASNAPITLVVFSDFECPYCARFALMMRREVLPVRSDQVRFVYRYCPLSIHPLGSRRC